VVPPKPGAARFETAVLAGPAVIGVDALCHHHIAADRLVPQGTGDSDEQHCQRREFLDNALGDYRRGMVAHAGQGKRDPA
jgi:hypothetical protein